MIDGAPLRVGDVLYGFCGCAFAKRYGEWRVEVIGTDYIVVRHEDGTPYFADGNPEHFEQYRAGTKEHAEYMEYHS